MFAVIFEVNPRPERWDDYLGYAKQLKPELEKIDGFMDNERFNSKRRPGWLLSLSTWRDEKALIRWRTLGLHHDVQEKGRSEVFRDYHLRVGEITADSTVPGGQVLRDQRLDETETGAAKLVAITERALGRDAKDADIAALAVGLGAPAAGTAGLTDWDVLESIYQQGKFLLLTSWRDGSAADAGLPPGAAEARRRRVRIIRDYGMFDRIEAPQYYPPVP
jgi:heme-degrading monooxygenase HmoA